MEKKAPYGYARMPRVIRKGYKHLTKLQKLLYIYLRDLCGESGMCYRSLRTLADETDFSTGYLSENIPLLIEAGLILAEKRKHNGKKWEIWHITIVDIWEENDKFIQAEKCSQDEQISPSEGVQEMNCSHDEQIDPSKCSPDEPNTPKVFTPALQVRSNITENPNYLNKKESTYSRSALFTSEQNRIDEMHNRCVSVPPPVTSTLKGHWDTLAPHIQTQEQMSSLFAYTERKLANKTDPEVKPGNLTRCLNGWQQEEKNKQQSWPQPDTSSPEPTEEPLPDMETYAGQPLDYWTEETMQAANMTKTRRRAIRRLQQEQAELSSTERIAI